MPAHSVWRKWVAGGVLILGALIVYWESLKNQFVNFDDRYLLLENAVVLNADVWGAFTQVVADDYLPLVFLTFMAENHFFGLNPFVYHLNNLILHLINVGLVFFFMTLIFRSQIWIPLFVASLFAVHPLHVESVAWVAERKDVLFAFFYFLGLIAGYQWIHRRHWKWALAAFLCLLLSLFSKLMAVSLPVIWFLMDWYFRRDLKKSLLEKIPAAAVVVAFIIVHIRLHKPEGGARSELHWMNAIDSIAFYLSKVWNPTSLSVFYQQGVVTVGLAEYLGLAAFAGLVAFYIWRKMKYHREVFCAISFFLVTIAPVLQVVPFGHKFIFADRLMYLPGLGLYLATALILWDFMERKKPSRMAAAGLAGAAVVACAVLTLERIPVWRNNLTLWEDAVSKYPQSSVAHNNLGSEYVERGEIQKGFESLKTAVELEPDYPHPRVGLGLVLSDMGRLDEALSVLQEAIRLDPRFARAHFNLGVVREKRGEFAESRQSYLEAIRLDAKFAEAYLNLGSSYYRSGERALAIEAFGKALEFKPNLPEAFNNYAHVLFEDGQVEKAISNFQRAVELDPEFLMARQGLAAALLKTGRAEEAAREIQKIQALQANPKPNYRRLPVK